MSDLQSQHQSKWHELKCFYCKCSQMYEIVKGKYMVYLSHLDPLQSSGGLCDALRHVKALGGADLGVDQPLLEVPESGTEPLLQQTLFVLAFPGRPQTQTGGRTGESPESLELIV